MIKNVPQVISLGLKLKIFYMSKVRFSPQKKAQKAVTRKQSSSVHKKKNEVAPCGAKVKSSKLFKHQLGCPQCQLEREYKNSKAA